MHSIDPHATPPQNLSFGVHTAPRFEWVQVLQSHVPLGVQPQRPPSTLQSDPGTHPASTSPGFVGQTLADGGSEQNGGTVLVTQWSASHSTVVRQSRRGSVP